MYTFFSKLNYTGNPIVKVQSKNFVQVHIRQFFIITFYLYICINYNKKEQL